jgi:predicted GNAT family acetyltransferase
MRTLMNDVDRDLGVVENDQLRRYELLLAGTTVGTLDFRVLGPRRVLGHTEIIAAQRGRGLATFLIRTVLDDLLAGGVQVTNYCPAVERFLQRHPKYVVVLDPANPPMMPPQVSAPLQQLVHAQHGKLRTLAAQSQDHSVDHFERRRTTDQFAAVAAQHTAAVADVLLATTSHSDADGAALLENLKQFEQALRVLKGRAYGDARFLGLSAAETWREAERLFAEHETTEARIVSGIEESHGTDGAIDVARALARRQWSSPTRPHPNSPHAGRTGRIARRLWRIADSTWDQLEGRGLPTEPIEHPKEHSDLSHYLFGTAHDTDDVDGVDGVEGSDGPRQIPEER